MSFRLIYELAAPREPDIKKVQRQIEIFGPVVDTIFVPDNHLGLPAMSSVAIAIEVKAQGFKPMVGLNARDRNHLRLASDLLTLKAYGIDEVVFLYGDPIDHGRTGLKVREMLAVPQGDGLKRGVAAEIGKPLGFKRSADFLMTQLAFGRAKAGYWREAVGFPHPVYCGVIAIDSERTAKRVFSNIPGLDPPDGYLAAIATDSQSGFRAALDELSELRKAGIDGAQIVVPSGWLRFSEMLADWSSGAPA